MLLKRRHVRLVPEIKVYRELTFSGRHFTLIICGPCFVLVLRLVSFVSRYFIHAFNLYFIFI